MSSLYSRKREVEVSLVVLATVSIASCCCGPHSNSFETFSALAIVVRMDAVNTVAFVGCEMSKRRARLRGRHDDESYQMRIDIEMSRMSGRRESALLMRTTLLATI
jgi:hypothetical protein